MVLYFFFFFFFQAEDGIRDLYVTGVQTCALPISGGERAAGRRDDPPDRGRFLGRVDRLDLGLDPGRGRELPRGHRQRGGHGALLLHPLRLPHVLQERLRGTRRVAVPADAIPPGRGGRVELLLGG